MPRLFASFIAGLACFATLISLAPLGADRQLVKDDQGHLLVLIGSPPANLQDPGQPSTPATKSPEELERQGLLNWRLQFAQHYQQLDSERSEAVAKQIAAVPSQATGQVTMAGFRSGAEKADSAQLESLQSESAAALRGAAYWQRIEQEAKIRAEQLISRQSAKMAERETHLSGGLEPLATMPGVVAPPFIAFALLGGLLIGVIRWIFEPRPDPELQAVVIESDTEIEPMLAELNRRVQSPDGPVLQIVLPVSWISSTPSRRLVLNSDRLAISVLGTLVFGLCLQAFGSPYGWQRLFWWPFAELGRLL